MDEIRDYYAFLGVAHNATDDEIKRAYVRKRRQYQNDDIKSTQLNQAYEALCDSAKRKKYDLNMQYGSQIRKLKEKVRNSETIEQRDKYLVEARKIYLEILKSDSENTDALWDLVETEKLFGNDLKAIQYLKRLEKCVEDNDKLQVYHQMGEIYKKLGKVDEAIKCYYSVYKANVAYVEDIKTLARFYYEDKKNLKEALQILNDCISRSKEARLKIVYLYETIRAIRVLNGSSYKKIEDKLYKKMEMPCTDNEDSNLANAAAILSCLEDAFEREDYECFHRIERAYQLYNIKDTKLNQLFAALQQIVVLIENGKVHEVINLYIQDEWTKEIRKKLGKLISKEAEKIRISLENIKNEAPEYWKIETKLADLEKLVNKKLRTSKEFNSLLNDRTISLYMKRMVGDILLEGFVEYEDIKDELEEACDSFFNKEDRSRIEHTLRKMKEYYPICYKAFENVFSDELSSYNNKEKAEISKIDNTNVLPYYPDAKDGYVHRPYVSGCLEVIFIIFATCCSPAAFPIIFIIKYYNRHEKKIKELIKSAVIILATLLIISVIISAGQNIIQKIDDKRQQEYNENHNLFLSDSDKKTRDELDKKYEKVSGIDIHVTQADIEDGVDYPDHYYIWLIIWDYGNETSYELQSNYLTEAEKDALWSDVSDIYSSDDTDIEKCKQFYSVAFDAVSNHYEEPEDSYDDYDDDYEEYYEDNDFSDSEDSSSEE